MQKEERVSIFIDGSNFYYSTAKQGKKVNFQKLIKLLIGDRMPVNVFYYVAPLDIEANEKKYWAHQKFLNKLREILQCKVVICTLKKIKIDEKKYMYSQGRCHFTTCVLTIKEKHKFLVKNLCLLLYLVKGDDIKLSNDLIMGAVDNLYDTAIVISGDEDFIDSINIVRKRYQKKVGNAYFSKNSSSNLRKECDFTIPLDKIINEIIDTKN